MRFVPAGFAAYATSKAAALTTMGILANELGARGITANSIMAGPIGSGFLDPSGDIVAVYMQRQRSDTVSMPASEGVSPTPSS